MLLERFHQIKQRSDEEALIDVHHKLMSVYGYISFEEFKKLPIPTIWNLLDRIQRDEREMAKTMRRKR